MGTPTRSDDLDKILDLLREFGAGNKDVRLDPECGSETWKEVAERLNGLLEKQQVAEGKEQLSHSPQLYEKVLSKSPIEVVIFDHQYRYLYVNSTSIKDPEIRKWVIGKTDREYCAYRNIDPKVADERFQLFHNVVKSGESLTIEQAMRDKYGNRRSYLRTLNPIFNEEGEMELLVGYSVDITDVKEKTAELEEKNEELEKANLELDQFVYRSSHDLRSPVTSLLGLSNLALDEEGLPEEVEEYLGLIKQTTRRMDVLIRNIVEYSKNLRQEVVVDKIDLEGIISKALNDIRHLSKFDQLQIEVEVNQKQECVTDHFRLAVILVNLLSNAVKFSVPGPGRDLIKVEAQVSAREIVIRIMDSGEGISKDHVSRVFEMFFRATRSAPGAGLGLYIVKEAVDRLRGKIHLTSELNKGTTVEVRLPNHAVEK